MEVERGVREAQRETKTGTRPDHTGGAAVVRETTCSVVVGYVSTIGVVILRAGVQQCQQVIIRGRLGHLSCSVAHTLLQH